MGLRSLPEASSELRDIAARPYFRSLASDDLTAIVSADRPNAPNLFAADLFFPVMVIKKRPLERNIAKMATWCRNQGVLLAPHAKTTMAPQIVARQLAAGAWGISVATISQARVFKQFGVGHILLANELVDRAAIDWLRRERQQDSSFDFLCYVDSKDGVQLLSEGMGETSARRLSVLVEMGVAHGRAGCRTPAQVLDIARAVAATPNLELRGIAGYEGAVTHEVSPEGLAAVRRYCRLLREATDRVQSAGLFPRDAGLRIISLGGSAFFDVVVSSLAEWAAAAGLTVILRSGAYVSHDVGIYRALSPFGGRISAVGPFEPALELWGDVLSRPEANLAIVGVGRRDTSWDEGYPVPTLVRHRGDPLPSGLVGWVVSKLNDQHAFLYASAAGLSGGLEIGDKVGFGISHPCTAFDRWQLIPMVDDGYGVVDLVRTFF
jgi:D-serine deaminase-like pyridoxal phosphate-dependent protein